MTVSCGRPGCLKCSDAPRCARGRNCPRCKPFPTRQPRTKYELDLLRLKGKKVWVKK